MSRELVPRSSWQARHVQIWNRIGLSPPFDAHWGAALLDAAKSQEKPIQLNSTLSDLQAWRSMTRGIEHDVVHQDRASTKAMSGVVLDVKLESLCEAIYWIDFTKRHFPELLLVAWAGALPRQAIACLAESGPHWIVTKAEQIVPVARIAIQNASSFRVETLKGLHAVQRFLENVNE